MVIFYLKEKKTASTGELITYVSKEANDCVDQVPHVLISLNKEGKIAKTISKEKKGFIWTLALVMK